MTFPSSDNLPKSYKEVLQEELNEDIEKLVSSPTFSWEKACEMILKMKSGNLYQYMLGRLALDIKKRWGKEKTMEWAKAIGVPYGTLHVYMWVIKKFGKDYKFDPDLGWVFYVRAAGTENPREVIKEAIKRKWSITDLKRYIKGNPLSSDCNHKWKLVVYKQCTICEKMKLWKK